MGKKRRSRILDEAEFRESFGYRRSGTGSTRQTPQTVIKTFSSSPRTPRETPGLFPSIDSASWTSRDDLGSRDELGSSGDMIEVGTTERAATFEIDRIETYSSSGVGSESSEVICPVPDQANLPAPDLPLEMQLQINRRASRYRPIQIRIAASSHVNVEQAGHLHHRVGRRKWQLVWCVVVDYLLYLYESIGADVTVDVINLSSYTPIANLTQPHRSKFKMKIVDREAETHEFYTESSSDFYLWFASFDRLHQHRPHPTTVTMSDPPKYDFLKTNAICLGLSPSAREKQKIDEKYRQLQVDCVVGVQSKMTRLTQRRHSTSQKISKMNFDSKKSQTGVKVRKSGLQNDLSEINEEIKQTVFYSKESMSRIAADRERELRGLNSDKPSSSSFEYLDESDENDLLGLSIDTAEATIDHRHRSLKVKKKNRLSGIGEKSLKKIQNFSRSLSRSKSAMDESARPTHLKLKKELSASSMISAPFDRPKSMIDFPKTFDIYPGDDRLLSDDTAATSTRSSNYFGESRAKLSIHQSSFEDDDCFGREVSTDESTVERREQNKVYNLSTLDESTLDEIRQFDQFATDFGAVVVSTSDRPVPTSAERPFRENLI